MFHLIADNLLLLALCIITHESSCFLQTFNYICVGAHVEYPFIQFSIYLEAAKF